MWNQKSSFRFEIDNFSTKEAPIASEAFMSGGCEWFLRVFPKGKCPAENHMSLYLYVPNPRKLPTGWKRSADFYFLVLNQSEKVLYSSQVTCNFQEKGSLENDKLIIEVYIGEVVEDVSEKKETVDINGFQVLVSQATLVSKLFIEHPDIAKNFKPKNEMVKTTYMTVLLNLIETLNKPSQNHSESELSSAHVELCEMMELGFKLDWLKSKLDKVSLERKKTNDADQSRGNQLEKRLVLMELESLKSKLEELSLEMKNADRSRVLKLEERYKNLEEDSLERKKAYDADESRIQQLEESVENLELIVSDLKLELEKEAKSSDVGFLLVDKVAY